MDLRDYQAQAFCAVHREFKQGRKSTLVNMATGTGKTHVFGAVARSIIEDDGGKVLILAHTDELIKQAANKCAQIGMEPAIEKASSRALSGGLFGDDPSCVVGSVQTLQGRRLREWPKGYFKLIVVDEGHHYIPGSRYEIAIQHLEPDWVLGVTATAIRADKIPLIGKNQPYETVAFEYSLEQGVRESHLKPPFYELVPTEVDLRNLRETGADYSVEELAQILKPHLSDLVNDSKEFIGDRRFIVFCPTVACAQAAASAYQSVGWTCESTHGNDPHREEIISGFADGRWQGLANAGVLTEGFDAPFVNSVVMMRPTKSWGLFMQMVGRGTRPYPGQTDCQVLGFNWKTLDHKLIHPIDLMDSGSRSPAVVDIAKELIDENQEKDLFRAVQRAEVIHKEREKVRLAIASRPARVKSTRYNPFTGESLQGQRPDEIDRADRSVQRGATANQINALHKFKVQFDEASIGFVQAGKMLDYLCGRAKEGLCTQPQKNALIRLGVPKEEALAMKFEEASATIDRLKRVAV